MAEEIKDPVIVSLECLMTNEFISKKYEEFKKTEEYDNLFNSVKYEKKNMSDYLIDLCLFGYYYETLLETIPEEERGDFKSILDQEEKILPKVCGDLPDMILSYDNYEEYLLENPHLKDIPVVGEPLKLIETEDPTIEKK